MLCRLVVLLAVVAGIASAAANNGVAANGPDSFCQGCRSIVSYLQTFNASDSRAEYKDVFKQFCEFYYPVSTDFQQGPCPIFLEGLFYVLDNIDPVNHCDQIGACDPEANIETKKETSLGSQSGKNFDNNIQLNRADNAVCEFCEQSVKQVKEALTDPELVDMIKQQLDTLCDYLKVVDQDKECKQVVKNNLNQLLDFIKHLEPRKYCAAIRLCDLKRKQPAIAAAVERQLPTLADFNNFGIETSVMINGHQQLRSHQVSSSPSRSASKGPTCVLCMTVVKEMFHFLKENKTEANIERGLNEICGILYKKGTNLDQCESMVKAYTRELIQLLIDETNPNIICTLLGECMSNQPSKFLSPKPPTTTEENLTSIMTALDPTIEANSPAACLECKVFINYLKHTLGDVKSEEELRDWLLSNLCDRMPERGLNETCSKIVQKYSLVLFKALSGELNPKAACVDLGCCRSGLSLMLIDAAAVTDTPTIEKMLHPALDQIKDSHPKPARQPSNKIINYSKFQEGICDECVQIITSIDEYLSNHSVDKDVSVLIDAVCNKMNDPLKSECTTMIRVFGNKIMQAISTMDNPRQLCSQIALC